MRFVLHTFSTGTPPPLSSLMLPPRTTSATFICSIAGGQTGLFPIGALKAEFLSLILSLYMHIGHFLPNGGRLNTKEYKNGGSERPSKASICSPMKSFGGRNKPSLTVSVLNRSLGSRSFRKKLTYRSLKKSFLNQKPSILTTHQQLNKHFIFVIYSPKSTEKNVNKYSQGIGCQNGIKLVT